MSTLISKKLRITTLLSCACFISNCVSSTPVKKPRPQPQKIEDRSIKIDTFSEAIAGFESKSMVSENDIDEAFVYKSGKVQIMIPLGDVEFTSGLTSHEILVVVRENLSAMRLCYEKELKKNPSRSGKIETRFAIELDGKPIDIDITGQHNCSQEFVACFSSVLSSMRFPKPRGGEPIEVVFPFVFSPI